MDEFQFVILQLGFKRFRVYGLLVLSSEDGNIIPILSPYNAFPYSPLRTSSMVWISDPSCPGHCFPAHSLIAQPFCAGFVSVCVGLAFRPSTCSWGDGSLIPDITCTRVPFIASIIIVIVTIPQLSFLITVSVVSFLSYLTLQVSRPVRHNHSLQDWNEHCQQDWKMHSQEPQCSRWHVFISI